MMKPAPDVSFVSHRVSLRTLKVGQSAIVTAVQHRVPAVRQKYLSRGIVPGAEVLVLHGGDPVLVALEESRWAIDGDEAEHIEVALVSPAAGKRWWRQLVHLIRNGLPRA